MLFCNELRFDVTKDCCKKHQLFNAFSSLSLLYFLISDELNECI